MADIDLKEVAEITDRVEAQSRSTQLRSKSSADNAITWHSASKTDVGRVRHINEDAFLDSEEQRLWVVADGMGGHSRGDFASSAVVEQLRTFLPQSLLLANLRDLEERLHAANERCRRAFRKLRPGTTVVAMFAHGGYCFFLWAGDSRAYRLRSGELVQLTEDHKLTQRINALTRAVGIRENLQLDLCYTPVQHGDRYLLCSDGLYNAVDSSQLCTALGQGSPEDACDSLVDLALAGGGRDNITVVTVEAAQPD